MSRQREGRPAPSAALLLAAIVESADDAIFSKTLDGVVTSWNVGAERLYGYGATEIIGESVAILAPPDRADEIPTLLAAVGRGEAISHFQTERVTRAGRRVQVSLTISPIRDRHGRIVGASTIARDITRERELEIEGRWRAGLVDALDIGVSVTNADHVFLYANQALARMYGVALDRLIGARLTEIDEISIRAESLQEIEANLQAESTWRGELTLTRVDGRKVTVEGSSSTIELYPDGVGRLTVVRDVTEHRSLEAQFRQAQRMEAVGQLAGGVAHDFNNILTGILGFAELAEAGAVDGDTRNFLDEITKAGHRAASLTRQLLAFSRRQILAPEVVDVSAAVRDLLPLLRRLLSEDIAVSLHEAPGSLVLVDRGQLEQVLVNLAVNARDAMPQGGRLSFEVGHVDLDPRYVATHIEAVAGPYVVIEVTDTGTGMTPEVQARAFEPFFTTKGANKGTGLGLATVFGIVRQSGGTIGVYSELGRGTVFKVYLPRAETSSEPARPPVAAAPPIGGHETILLVEDDPAVRTVATLGLRCQGYTVLVADDVEHALRLARDHDGPIDLLLTDVVMPVMNGRDLSQAIAQVRPGMRTLFASGYTEDTIVHLGVLDEGIDFLHKPFTPSVLVRRIREIMDRPPEGA